MRRAGKSDDEIRAEVGQRREDAEPAEGQESFADAQRRKEIAQANLKEMEERERRGELVDATEAAKAWEQAGSQINSEMLNIPDRVAMRLEGKNAREIREILMTEIRKALLIVSDKLRAA